MIITLYTSRVILDKLGIEDYGLYSTIGSVVTSISFLNASLSLASSRFITYDIGKNDENHTNVTFNNILLCYAVLALFVLIILESLGPWFVENKLVYDSSQKEVVQYLFQFSLITVIFSLISTPFTSQIIAHEDMDVYAYIGIYEAFIKLLIAFAISFAPSNKLMFYGFVVMVGQLSVTLVNFCYSKISYKETQIDIRKIERGTLKSIVGFSCWSLIGTLSTMLSLQGITIITNMFFGSAIVAGRAISVQVNGAVNQLVSQLRTAVNPQMVKRHATGNEIASKNLLVRSTIVSFILTYIICLILLINAKFLLNIWLVEVPDYTVPFVQLILIQSVLMSFENSFYSVFYAHGRVKENSLVNPIIGITMFVVIYYLFRAGYSPLWLSYCYIICTCFSCLIIKPYLICKLFDYECQIFIKIFRPSLILVLCSFPIFLVHLLINNYMCLLVFICESLIICLYLFVISYLFVIDVDTKNTIHQILSKFNFL